MIKTSIELAPKIFTKYCRSISVDIFNLISNVGCGITLLNIKAFYVFLLDDDIAKAEALHVSSNNTFQDFARNFNPSQSNEWYNKQDSYQNAQHFSQPNSAFAPFDYKKPYNFYEPPQVNHRTSYNYHSSDPSEKYNSSQNRNIDFQPDYGQRSYNNDQRSYNNDQRNFSNDRPNYRYENQGIRPAKYDRQQNKEPDRQERTQNQLENNKENFRSKYNNQRNDNKNTVVKKDITRAIQFPVKSNEISPKDFMPKFTINNLPSASASTVSNQEDQVTHQVSLRNKSKQEC